MIETVTVRSQPLLYISTRTSERSSSVAATVKASLDQVLAFMDEQGIGPAGKPVAIFSDWNGRLVTIDAGYPVSQDSLTLASGRIQAGRTPEGPAAHATFTARADTARQHEGFAEDLRAAGQRLTGTTWEVYAGAPGADAAARTDLYAQLLDAHHAATPFGG